MLAYCLTEYAGELYRITLSTCAGDEKRFIFVIWGTANVTERKHLMIIYVFIMITIVLDYIHTYPAKFNCTIPGTLYSHSIDCPAPQTTIHKRGPNKGSGDEQHCNQLHA